MRTASSVSGFVSDSKRPPMARPGSTTIASWVLLVGALIPTLYQSITFTIEFADEPVTTIFTTVEPVYRDLSSLIMCTNLWATMKTKRMVDDEGLAYFTGFSANNEMASVDIPETSYDDIIHNATELAEGRARYQSLVGNHSLDKIIGALSIIKGIDYKRAISLAVTPHFVKNTRVCGLLNPFMPFKEFTLSSAENLDAQLVDSPNFQFSTSDTNIFNSKDPDRKVYLSLYKTKFFAFLSDKKHFFEFGWVEEKHNGGGGGSGSHEKGEKYEESGGAENSTATALGRKKRSPKDHDDSDEKGKKRDPLSYRVTRVKIDIRRFTYLTSRKHKCLEVPTDIKGNLDRLPIGFASRLCSTKCEEEAFIKVHNCSIFRYFGYDKLFENVTDREPCHVYDNKLPGKIPVYSAHNEEYQANDAELLAVKHDCAERESCSSLKYCEEWEFKAYSVTSSIEAVDKYPLDVPKNDSVLHSVSIVLPDRLSLATQHFLIGRDTWMGTIGGIIGLYLGASLFSGAAIIVRFIVKRCDKKSYTELLIKP